MVRIQSGYVMGEETLGLVLCDTPLGELSKGSMLNRLCLLSINTASSSLGEAEQQWRRCSVYRLCAEGFITCN